jgi:cysteinyl-tRNA synthetase
MSKSLGNIYTLQDILDKGYDLRAFKMLVLSKHYRTEGNFTWDILDAAQNRLKNWQSIADLYWQTKSTANPIELNLLQRLQDDLNTPDAVAGIDWFLSTVEQEGRSANHESIANLVKEVDSLLGLKLLRSDISDSQKQLITDRESARKAGNYAKSDALRRELEKQGIEINDTPGGPVWSRL